MKKLFKVLKNLIYWYPIICNDRQWDQTFLIKILEHKLRAMDEFFSGSDPRLVSHRRSAKEIRYCRILCTRILQHDYLMSALRPHEAEWGGARCILGESTGPSVPLLEIAVPHLTGQDREREKAIRYRLYKKATRQEDQDWSELFRLIGKQIRGWWD